MISLIDGAEYLYLRPMVEGCGSVRELEEMTLWQLHQLNLYLDAKQMAERIEPEEPEEIE